jgi:hypothetical protein
MTDSSRTPLTVCWHCDRPLDAASGFGDTEGLTPEPGAISLCMYCGAVAVFGPDLQLEKPSEELLDGLEDSREFRQTWVRFMWARQRLMLTVNLMRDREDPDR